MRIISKFYDYYDCIQRLGQDRSIVYLREKEVIEGWPFPKCSGYYGPYDNHLIRARIIGFCGKITPLVELRTDQESPLFLCWDIKATDAFMQAHMKAHEWRDYRKSSWSWRLYFRQFFEECAQRESSFEYLFRDHHSPLFVASASRYPSKPKIVFNACLKDVQFYTRFNSYQAFQEIAMYMGGVLGTHGGHKIKYKGEPMSSEVSDRDLAAAKGFDKLSFRKEKKPPKG